MTTSSIPCYHCGSDTESKSALHADLGGTSRPFCCAGCMAVAQTIYGEGLESFYQRQVPAGERPDYLLAGDELPETLEVYNDPTLQARFVKILDSGFAESILSLEKIRCAACVWLCDHHLQRVFGIDDVQINYVTLKAIVRFDPQKITLPKILYEVQRIGYLAWPYEPSELALRSKRERRNLLFRLGVALLGMMQVMMYAWPIYTDSVDLSLENSLLLNWTSWLLTVPVVLYSAAPIFSSAWRSVRSFAQTRSLGMDVPIALALGMAFTVGTVNLVVGDGPSYFDSITMFVAFTLGARYIELIARQDAQSGSEALAKQLPASCERYLDYPKSTSVERIPVVRCLVGDRVRVGPGEIIPADGVLIDSYTSVSEALLTGESRPIQKSRGDHLFAGTHNIQNSIAMEITAVGQTTRLAGIAILLDRALQAKPPLLGLAEIWAGRFVILLIIAAIISSATWLLVDPSRAWPVMLGVLVASCPCALSLAIPTALAAAQGALTKIGLFVIHGRALEGLSKANTLVMDKTGTLTIGEPRIQTITVLRNGMTEGEVLALAVGMEEGQNHPLGLAFGLALRERGLMPHHFLERSANHLGKGLSNGNYRLGKADWVGVQALPTPFDALYSHVYLGDDQGLIAQFSFLDRPREGVAALLQYAHVHGIAVHLLSGDTPATVEAWAHHHGIAHYQGGASPEEKYEFIRQLQADGAKVCAIGDGVNDAPFLAKADVSIAMGSGAPLAAAGADAVLISSNFETLVKAFSLAHRTQKIIRQNLLWAFLYNVTVIPVAMMAWINPWVAGIGMASSSLLVTLNAWRLRKV
ncbi:MAG: heavy metal translocating P-type ATPase [Burkholderiaceae bacterium]|nr:heavy metal translocating P-type ATPase [Burkholderiaceae bacterium]